MSPYKLLISQSPAPLPIKFALFCLHKVPVPKWFAYFCFVLSHLQTLAVIMKSAYLAFPDNTPSSSPIVKFFLKIFVIGDLLSEENTTVVMVGTVVITVYTLKMLGLILYINFSLAKKREVPVFIQRYWSIFHSMHPLLLFFWIHTFCVEVMKYSKHDNGMHLFMTIMSYFNTTINCAFAVFFSIISVIYKTKELISSKTNVLQTKGIIFKILVPILWLAAENNKGVQILVLILSLVNAISHDWILIKYLPYYRVNLLVLSAVLQALQTSLALVSLILKIIIENGSNKGILSVDMLWLLMVPIFGKAYYVFIWKTITHAFECNIQDEKSVYYLIHKRFILLHFMKSRNIIHEAVKKLDVRDLMYQARLASYAEDLGVSFEELDKDKKLLKRNLRFICREIFEKDPKALLAQIGLASSYSKFDDLYLASNNLLEDALLKNPGYRAQISLGMIRLELQRKLLTMEQGSLDVSGYLVNQELQERLKKNMGKQANMQLEYWKQFVQNKPDMLSLMNIAQKINSQKRIVKKLWSDLLEVRPAEFLYPLRMYGMYCCMINNDNIEGEKYLEQSQEDAKRMKRILKMDELNNQTIFSDKTVKITMSGLRSKLGKVLDCSSNISSAYGWQCDNMNDRPIASLMPPFYRQRHDKFLMNHYHTGEIKMLNQTLIFPVKASDGFIRPTWMNVKVNPRMDQGISYVALLRPCKSNQRMILVRKDGKIDGMSAEFAKDMGLKIGDDHVEEDIFMLCPDFQKVNEAFNVMALKSIEEIKFNEKDTMKSPISFTPITNKNRILAKKSEEMTEKYSTFSDRIKNDSEFIYDNFTAGGGRNSSKLVFYPKAKKSFFGTERSYTTKQIVYDVKIENKIHGEDIIKWVMLIPENNLNKEETLSSEEPEESLSPIIPEELYTSVNMEKEEYEMGFPSPQKGPDGISFSTFDELHSTSRKMIFKSFNEENNISTFPSRKHTFHTQLTNQTSFPLEETMRAKEEARPSQFSQKRNQHSGSQEEKVFVRRNRNNRSTLLYQNEENLKDKKQEDNIDVEKSESVGVSYRSGGRKAEQQIVETLKMKPKKRSKIIYSLSFFVFVFGMIILLAVQERNLNNGIKEVENQIPVITTASLRQIAMVSSSAMIRAWSGFIQGYVTTGDWNSDNLLWRMSTAPYVEELNKYNKEFYSKLGGLSTEAQSRFYEPNVNIYVDRDGDTTGEWIAVLSTSQAYQVIIEKEQGIVKMELPSSFSADIPMTKINFVLNNTLNDLYVQSQNQIDLLKVDLEDSTSSTVLNMGLTLAGVLVICGVFLVASIRYLYIMGKEARIFMVMIFRLKPHECEAIQTTILSFKNGLSSDMEAMKIIEKEGTVRSNAEISKFRSASMDSLYMRQRFTFLKLLPNFVLFIVWSALYFFLTKDLIGDIKASEKQMETALDALNSQSLLAAEFVTVLLTNSTAVIKNELIMKDFLVNLNYLQESTVFVENLRDEKGQLTSLQESVLFNFPCEDFLTLYDGEFAKAYDSCVAIGKEKGSIGLIGVNSQFYAFGRNALEMFEASSRTEAELANIFMYGIVNCINLIYSAEGLLNILYMSTNDNFNAEVDTVKKDIGMLTWMVFAAAVIGPVVTWYMVMKKIFRLQKIDWEILQIIPIKLILGNKYLQQYLVKHSNRILDKKKFDV